MKKLGGKDGYHTTYQPISENPIHTTRGGTDPENPNGWNSGIKWGLVGLGAYRVVQEYKDHVNSYNFKPAPAVKDNTNVYIIGPSKRN